MFDINTLEGREIPITQEHANKPTFHPIGEAMRESIDPNLLVDVYPLHEKIEVFQRTAERMMGIRFIGTLMTAGTLDEWLSWYGSGEFREGVLSFYKQDDHEEHGTDPDERIWIGFREAETDPINDLLTEKGSEATPAEIHEVIVSGKGKS